MISRRTALLNNQVHWFLKSSYIFPLDHVEEEQDQNKNVLHRVRVACRTLKMVHGRVVSSTLIVFTKLWQEIQHIHAQQQDERKDFK